MSVPHEVSHQGYLISDNPEKIDMAVVKAFLKTSYWAASRPESVIDESFRHGLRVGVYAPSGAQVGGARMITDFATYGWLCDVFVMESERGKGLSKALMAYVHAHPRLQTIGRFFLGTRDAHGLYAQFGYTPVVSPERLMEKRTAAFIAIPPLPPKAS